MAVLVDTSVWVAHFRERNLHLQDLLERDDRKLMKTNHQLRVAVTADFITMLTASSGAAVQGEGNFTASDCVFDASSGAVITANGLAPRVLVVRESSGAAVTLAGTAPRLDVRASGGSTFDGQKLQSENCQLEANGGSVARVFASKELMLEATGGSVLRYFGPAAVTKSLSGGSTAK